MAFQPFGYRFEVHSALPPDAVNAAIRSRTKGWLHTKRGARGWIVGPFICLWLSAFDRHGPMLVGRIAEDQHGTRIIGRAGSDLNGVAMLVLLIPLLAFCCYQAWFSGEVGPMYFVLMAGVIGICFLAIWVNHKDRQMAEPLVRFLSDAVGKPRRSPRLLGVTDKFLKTLVLEISGTVLDDPATPNSVRDALLEIEGDGFVIMSSTREQYMQTVGEAGGYVIEKREGDDLHHYRAVRNEAISADASNAFTFEETLAAFLAYGSGASLPSFMDWKPIRP